MEAFVYGENDQSNWSPIIKAKHLSNSRIVGSANQKLYFFRLLPFVFADIITQPQLFPVYM